MSRTVLTSLQEFREVQKEFRDMQRKDHEEWTAQMKELRDAQAETGEKLNFLICRPVRCKHLAPRGAALLLERATPHLPVESN